MQPGKIGAGDLCCLCRELTQIGYVKRERADALDKLPPLSAMVTGGQARRVANSDYHELGVC